MTQARARFQSLATIALSVASAAYVTWHYSGSGPGPVDTPARDLFGRQVGLVDTALSSRHPDRSSATSLMCREQHADERPMPTGVAFTYLL